jgi:leader peptidase (prepilin peptidase)/N-methyltransferase
VSSERIAVEVAPSHSSVGICLVGICLVGAAVEGALCWRFGWSPALPAFCFIGAVGTAASVIDVRTRRIPSRLLVPSYPIAAALLVIASAAESSWWPLARGAIAMSVIACCYLVLALTFVGQFGMADVRIGGLLGFYLGWLGWPTVMTGTFSAWLLAALFVAWRCSARRVNRIATLPMGPFLVAGAFIAILLAQHG